MADKTNADRLQAYTKNGRARTIITEPGYEIYFFSRMNANSAVNPFSEIFDSKISDFEDVKLFADYVLSSANSTSLGLNRNDTPIVSDIMVRQSVADEQGSVAEIKIINPENVEFFKRTIGNEKLDSQLPDYDWHGSSDTRPIRIGTLDTVIIKLINSSTDFQGTTTKKETVFRGIIGDIARTKSATSGSKMILHLFDFTEFIRNFNALPIGAFSTIIFGITGRDLVNDLLRYSNQLVTGNWNFLSKDPGATASLEGYGTGGAPPDPNSPPDPNNPQTQEDAKNKVTLDQIHSGIVSQSMDFVDFTTGKEVSTGSLSVGTKNENIFHAMRVPPFFWLEYTETQFTKGNSGYIPDNVYGTTFNIKTSFNDAFQTAINDTKKAFADMVSGGLLASANKAFNGLLTPEDNFTVKTYNAFPLASQTPNIPKKGGITDNFNELSNNLFSQQNIWIATDLYLEKSLVTIEHQQIWKTIWDLAQRSMREVYFDFAPKIKKDARVLFETENLVDALTAGLDIHAAHDVHPNVGILKYRLSPCFIPFKDGISKNVNGDKFETFWQHRFYDIHEDQIVETISRESEEGVFTAVFGFPQSLNKATIQDEVIKIEAGQNRGFITVQSLDPRIEERLGYRFMTDHDQKIRQGPLMYLTSYVLLHKSQMQMFAEQIIIPGNPYVQAGSIVRLFDRNIDYYCHQVTHNWTLEGYSTSLEMNYGHLTGEPPKSLVGNIIEGSLNADTSKDSKDTLCRLKATSLEAFVPGSKIIGAIKVQCLVSALWEFMTNSAQSDAALQNASSRKKINVAPSGVDWITRHGWSDGSQITYNASNIPAPPSGAVPMPASILDPIINKAIRDFRLDEYHVTLNAMKNVVFLESSFVANAVAGLKNPQPAYGLFQLVSYVSTGDISAQDACFNFEKAAYFACKTLYDKMSDVNKGKVAGAPFLDGFAAYNGGGSEAAKYPALVFGAEQANAIRNNSQSPDSSSNESKWPFNVYGPIGMQTSENGKQKSSADIIGFKGSDADYIKELNTFGTKESGGMSDSVKYLTFLLNKYQKSDTQFAPYNGNEAFAKSVTQQDLFEKVVAAWYTNDGNVPFNKINLGIMRKVIESIRHHYDECINCTASTSSYNPASDKELSTVLKGLKFIPPISDGIVTSPYGPRIPPTLPNGKTGSGNHPGVDIGRAGNADGAQIVATENGTVVDVFYDDSGGYFVLIDHGNGVLTQTLDLQTVTVQKNTKVNKGQQIGTIGLINGQSPPYERGLHVHWEIRTGANYPSSKGATRDPIAVLKAQGNGIA